LRLILIKRFYPDILHVHFHQAGLMAMLFCKVFRIKVVVTEHWTAFVGYPAIPPWRFEKAREVFEFAKYVLPVSDHLRKGIEEKTGMDLSQKYAIINNSVDIKIFQYQPYDKLDNNKTILVVARLDEQKDLPNLFKALGILKKKEHVITLKIIGKGDAAQYNQALVENDIEEHVQFLGEKSKQQIATEMLTSDVLCLSSISENSPCVIGEAFCTGLPVVSTHVGGIPELFDDTNGILVPPKDPEQLALALYEALYVRTFNREAISQRAQAHFSYQAIGAQLFKVYQKVLA